MGHPTSAHRRRPRGVGDGTFAGAVHYAAGRGPRSVAIGDLDADQAPDLAVANEGLYPDPGTVSVLLGLGDGTFAAAVNYPGSDRPFSVAIGDLDGDQVPDLAVANSVFNGSVSVLLGLGDGTFGAAVHYAVGDFPRCVAIAHLDGDQAPDLAVANSASDNVSVLLNQSELPGDLNCDGVLDAFDIDPFVLALTAPSQYAVEYPDCDWMLGDINSDGYVDAFDIDPFVELLVGS